VDEILDDKARHDDRSGYQKLCNRQPREIYEAAQNEGRIDAKHRKMRESACNAAHVIRHRGQQTRTPDALKSTERYGEHLPG